MKPASWREAAGRALGAGLFVAALVACTSLPPRWERRAGADDLAAARDWRGTTIAVGGFDLAVWMPKDARTGDELTVYIEGDGLAWLSPETPSADPTPVTPLALKLALAQPEGNAVYLARPCQYLAGSRCQRRYWTEGRFAPEVVAAMGAAVDDLKRRFQARRLTLVGYSGGAAVAALLAVRRDDVVRLVTVAANLDHRAWTQYHRVALLADSLNPADDRAALAALPQWHFVGGRDPVVPPQLVETFVARMPAAHTVVIDDYDHKCCWAEKWPELWRQIH